ncbi:ligand-gated channel protein [Shewanella algae]|uniref:ligand-gated channel protein n=1 Tax=Shewanella algae TaxID=38313 RepID=UPI003AB08D08
MSLCRISPLASAIAALFLIPAAQADEASQDMEVIVVTASGYEQQLKDAPASISVLTREQLDSRFYRDITDAMLDVPGVVVTGGSDRRDISLRGMGSQYTLILVDGMRQSSRETRTNSDGPGVEGAWTPPLSAIDRIEVVRGPMSSLYGSDAIGGVINIITRKVPENWQGELRLDSTVQEHSESGNIYQGNFFVSGALIPNWLGLQLYGQYTKREEDQITGGYRGRDANNLSARFSLTPSDDHDIILEVSSAVQELDSTLGKTVAPLAPGESCGRYGCPASSTTEYESRKYSLAHTGRWEIGTSNTWVKYEEFENKSREMTIKNTDAQTSLITGFGDSHTTTFGAAFNYQDLSDKTGNQIGDRSDISRRQWSVFAENEWRMSDTFALTAGLRMDDDENFGEHFSPRIYGVWDLTDSTTLKGGVSTGFRAPSLRQTVPDWGQVSRGGNMYGNPDLKPETSINYELGLHTGFGDNITTALTVFYNEFEDKITRVPCPESQCTDGPNQFGSDPTTYVNVDEAVTQGFELDFNYDINDDIQLSANYTYTDSEQKTGRYQGSPLNQLPKHLLQTSLNWQINDSWGSWARVHYRGEESQPTTGPSSSTLVAPSYTLVDIGANLQLMENLKLSAGIYNLLDKEITQEEYGYIEDGRRYWLGMTWSF